MSDGFGEHDPKKMPRHLFGGALSLDYASAQRADISGQHFSVCPRHWYIDATFRCPRCARTFVFTADEQRLWYEQFKFWIDSHAKHCERCRRELRHLKALQQAYDRDIRHGLTREAGADRKRRLVELMDGLAEGGVELPAQMLGHRQTLQNQLDRISQSGTADPR